MKKVLSSLILCTIVIHGGLQQRKVVPYRSGERRMSPDVRRPMNQVSFNWYAHTPPKRPQSSRPPSPVDTVEECDENEEVMSRCDQILVVAQAAMILFGMPLYLILHRLID